MSDYISLTLTGVFLVFILFGMIWGIIRGLKKTISRGLFLLITSIVLIFLAIPITKALCNIPLNINLTIDDLSINGTGTIFEILEKLLEHYLGQEFYQANSVIIETITILPITILSSIVYVILFWVCKIILIPLNMLFTKLFYIKRKNSEEMGFSAFGENNENKSNVQDDQVGVFIKKGTEYNTNVEHDPLGLNKQEEEQQANENKKATKNKKEKIKLKENKKEKENKHRLLGGLVGALVGIIVMVNTLTPFYGIISILKTNQNTKINNLTSEPTSASEMTNGLTDTIITSYKQSVLGIVSENVAIESLALAEFDTITSKTIDGKKISLRDDINNLINTVVKIDTMVGYYKEICTDNTLKNITQEELDTLITYLDEVVLASKEVKCIDILGDYIIPITSQYLVKSNFKLTKNVDVNTSFLQTLQTLTEKKDINIFEEISNILDLFRYTNEQKLLLPIINGDKEKIVVALMKTNDDFTSNFTNKLFAIKTVNTTIPSLLNLSLHLLDNSINFGFASTELESEKVKNDLTNIISSLLTTAKTIDSNSTYYITTESIVPLGRLLDSIKNASFLTDTSYKNLLNYTVNKLKSNITNLFPEDYKEYLETQILNNLDEIPNWENEVKTIKSAVDILRDNEYGILGNKTENGTLREGFGISSITLNEGTINNLGKALDELEKTTLLGSPANLKDENNVPYTENGITKLIFVIIDMINEELDNPDNSNFSKLKDVTNLIQSNIKYNFVYTPNNSYWENEMKAISPLITNIYSMLDSSNINIRKDIGEDLDRATTGLIFRDRTTLKLMSVCLSLVKDEVLGKNFKYNSNESTQTTNDKIYELFVETSEKTESDETYNYFKNSNTFWTEEIDYYISLQNLANSSDHVSSISEAYDLHTDLDNIYNSKTISKLSVNKLIAMILDEIKTSDTTGTQGQINETLTKISNKLKDKNFLDGKDTKNFWKIELGNFNKINNIDFESSNIKNELSGIGKILDETVFGILDNEQTPEDESVRPSYLIEHIDIRNILSASIDEMHDNLINSSNELGESINTALNSIKSNIRNVEDYSFEFELDKIKELSDIEISNDVFNFVDDEEVFAQNQKTIKTLGRKLDNVSYNTKNQSSVIVYNESQNSKIVTRSIINTLVLDIIDFAKDESFENTELPTDKDKFKLIINDLIDDIKTNITNHSNTDSVFSWTRELLFVHKLSNINKSISLKLDNVIDTFATNLDNVAFNLDENNNKYNDIVFNANCEITYLPEENKGNSLFVTRNNLKTAVSKLTNIIKTNDVDEECQEIVRDLLDNVSNKVAGDDITQIDTTKYYKSFTDSFDALNRVKDSITSHSDNFDGENLSNIITNNTAKNYDTMLNDLQKELICHNTTTRKVSILLFEKLYETMVATTSDSTIPTEYKFENLDAGKYMTNLINHYKTNNTQSNASEISESYLDETKDITSTDITIDFDNPFQRLTSIYNI